MANQASATPSLDPSVPRIPSPSSLIQPTIPLAEKAEKEVPSTETTGKASETEHAAPLASEQSSELGDTTGEFSPSLDCDPCVVFVPPPVEELGVNVQDEERSTPDTDIDDLRSNSRCCPECEGFSRVYYALSDLTDSKYAIPLWLLIMLLPISAGFMGARYLNDCKYSPTTPPLMFLMGLTGAVMITVRIIIILHRATWEHAVGRTCLYTTMVLTYILTLLIFCTELMTFWRYTPSFDKSSPNYCNPTFHAYTYWINCTTILVSVLMFIIRIPTCLCSR